LLNFVLNVVNGSDFINNPWNVTFSPYTDLLTAGFYLIPLCFIAAALYMKTRNGIAVTTFILGSGLLLVSGSIFLNYPEMARVFLVFAAAGMVGTFIAVFINVKWK
jgi:hypothetical protein